MSDVALTILTCYLLTGVYVFVAGDGPGDAVNQSLTATLMTFAAITLAWPWPVWIALRSWRGR